MFPEDCLQSTIAGDWWITDENPTLQRGALVFAFVPHIDQVPYRFEPIGRKEATEHGTAVVRVAPLKVDAPLKKVDLPVAAMPLDSGEVWAAYRAKRRPCLVLGTVTPEVEKKLSKGMPNYATAQTLLVAPYYGADKDGTRAGYNSAFVERIRHCEYPQYVWDCLPIKGGPKESILKLGQLQPIGAHYQSYSLTKYRLSDAAMQLMDDMLMWVMCGGVPEESTIIAYRDLLQETIGQ